MTDPITLAMDGGLAPLPYPYLTTNLCLAKGGMKECISGVVGPQYVAVFTQSCQASIYSADIEMSREKERG